MRKLRTIDVPLTERGTTKNTTSTRADRRRQVGARTPGLTVAIVTVVALVLAWALPSSPALADNEPEHETRSYPLAVPNPCSGEVVIADVSVSITRHRHEHVIVALTYVDVTTSDGAAGTAHETVVNNGNYNRHLTLILDNEHTGEKWSAVINVHVLQGLPTSIPIDFRCIRS